MRIPGFILKDTVTVKPFTGSSAYGPTYGAEVSEKWNLQPGFKKVTNSRGEEEVASIECLAHPTSVVTAQSRVTWAGRVYEVIDAQPVQMGATIHHVEVWLKSTGASP